MISSLEKVVYKILHESGVNFQREKTFQDCYNGKYRFDFFLPDENVLLEVQGHQHYEYIPKFYKNRSDFLKSLERDRRKASYALANRISLYCIPYWEIQNLKTVDDLLNPKFRVRSAYHNDEAWRAHQNLR